MIGTLLRGAAIMGAFALFTFSDASSGMGQTARVVNAPIVRIATLPIDQTADVYYAQDEGFFEAAGLKVKIENFANGPAAVAALLGGAYDIGVLNASALAAARERGILIKFIAPSGLYVSSAPDSLLMVQADSSISSARDLDGKTIALTGLNTLSHVAVRAWVTQHGGDLSSVHFVELPFPAMAPALQQGRIDAAFMSEPFITLAKGTVRPLASPFDAIAKRFLIAGWMATDAWIREHPDEAQHFVTALLQAHEWANRHHHESAAILVRHSKIEMATVTAMVRPVYGTTLDPALIQPVLDTAAKYGILGEPMSAASIIWK